MAQSIKIKRTGLAALRKGKTTIRQVTRKSSNARGRKA